MLQQEAVADLCRIMKPTTRVIQHAKPNTINMLDKGINPEINPEITTRMVFSYKNRQ